jgi:hypothetical protein
MPTVVSYKVGVTRSHKPGPVRSLTLKLDKPSDGATGVTLFFFEKELPAFGFLNRSTSTVVVNLPLADFEPTYHILNTEKPVFTHFRIHGDDNKLLSFDVSTSEEPVGEGPVDTSP